MTNNPTENTNDPDLEEQIESTESESVQPEVDGNAETIPLVVPTSDVEALRAAVAEAEKRTLLAQADLENFRRRKTREVQDQLRFASMPLMTEILEAADNLNRAVDTHESNASAESLLAGVKMVAEQIATIMESHGCKKIASVGEPFDPNLHQAVQMQASDDFDANIVIQELRTGYQLHDRVIRPAQVFVSTGPA